MQPFIRYSLLASLFWGVMSIIESIAGQHRMHGALLAKYICYGIFGVLFLVCLKGRTFLYNDLAAFSQERPTFLAFFCLAMSLGAIGAYFMYCAFQQCGSNKAIAIIISYCVPSVIVAILSYVVLKESYNMFAILGMLMIVGGVVLIDVYGTHTLVSTK